MAQAPRQANTATRNAGQQSTKPCQSTNLHHLYYSSNLQRGAHRMPSPAFPPPDIWSFFTLFPPCFVPAPPRLPASQYRVSLRHSKPAVQSTLQSLALTHLARHQCVSLCLLNLVLLAHLPIHASDLSCATFLSSTTQRACWADLTAINRPVII